MVAEPQNTATDVRPVSGQVGVELTRTRCISDKRASFDLIEAQQVLHSHFVALIES
jgi:hypothetical protein